MNIKGLIFVVLVMSMFLQGCETAKGMKKDLISAQGSLRKADDWMRENMW